MSLWHCLISRYLKCWNCFFSDEVVTVRSTSNFWLRSNYKCPLVDWKDALKYLLIHWKHTCYVYMSSTAGQSPAQILTDKWNYSVRFGNGIKNTAIPQDCGDDAEVKMWPLTMTCALKSIKSRNELQHDKTNKMSVRPAKTQISLDSDQPGHPPSLIRSFAVCLVGS